MTITQLASLATSISVVAASCAAVYGITAWHREYVGKQRIDLAEEVLALFYEARDALQWIRYPAGWMEEGKTRRPSEGETAEQKDARDRAYVVFERYEKQKDVFNRLRSLRYRFMARFGLAQSQPFEELNSALNQVFSASRRLSYLWARRERPGASQEQIEEYQQQLDRYEKLFWADQDENDEVEHRIQAAVEEIERIAHDLVDNPNVFKRIARRLHRRGSAQC